MRTLIIYTRVRHQRTERVYNLDKVILLKTRLFVDCYTGEK